MQLSRKVENYRNGEMTELVNKDGERREKDSEKKKPACLAPRSLFLGHSRSPKLSRRNNVPGTR
jgi:hypothetical protein